MKYGKKHKKSYWTMKQRKAQSKKLKEYHANKKQLVISNVMGEIEDERAEEEEAKLAFICGKAQQVAETLALQSGLPLRTVTQRLGEFFQRS